MTEETKKDEVIVEEVKSKSVKKREEISKKVEIPKVKDYMICSRLNHPVELKYGGKSIMLAPRAQMKVKDKELLSNLPNGVYIRECV